MSVHLRQLSKATPFSDAGENTGPDSQTDKRGSGFRRIGAFQNTPAAPEIVPVFRTRSFLGGLGAAHSRRIGIFRIVDKFQNVSREAGSTSVPYGVGFPPPPVGVGFVEANIRWSLSRFHRTDVRSRNPVLAVRVRARRASKSRHALPPAALRLGEAIIFEGRCLKR